MEPNPAYEQILVRARDVSAEWGGRVVVVYIPSLDRFGGVFPHGFVQNPLRNMVKDAAKSAGIEVIDLTPVFKEQGAPQTLYAADAHFNAEGAALAAEAILNHSALATQ